MDSDGDAQQEPRIAAFFDVDNTIVRGASLFMLALGLRRRGIVSTSALLRAAVQHIDYRIRGENPAMLESVQKKALSIVAGRSVAEIVAAGEEVYDEVIAGRIWRGAQRLIDAHLAEGHEVWLVTASPREVASIVAKRLGATGALASRAHSSGGIYSGALDSPLVHGAVKADVIRDLATQRGIDLGRSIGYGDSINDVPMLRTVGRPVAINPDRKLGLIAAREGWGTFAFTAVAGQNAGRVKSSAQTAWRRVSVRRAAYAAGIGWTVTLLVRRKRR